MTFWLATMHYYYAHVTFHNLPGSEKILSKAVKIVWRAIFYLTTRPSDYSTISTWVTAVPPVPPKF
jgi:hypothetical protein